MTDAHRTKEERLAHCSACGGPMPVDEYGLCRICDKPLRGPALEALTSKERVHRADCDCHDCLHSKIGRLTAELTQRREVTPFASDFFAVIAERDQLREELVKLREHLKQVDAVVQTALRSATSREAMLREALAKHGRHGRDCDITLYGNDPGVIIECTCGLDDALAGAADEPSEYHPLPFWHECEHFAGWTRDADYQCQNCAPPEFEAL